MTLALFQQKREKIMEIAARYGAKSVRVFGSVARGDADEACDIDFLVDLEPGRSLFDQGGLLYDLQQYLDVPVDAATEKAYALESVSGSCTRLFLYEEQL